MADSKVLDGRSIAGRIKQAIQRELDELKERTSDRPTLGILYFVTPASETYKRAQVSQAASLGIEIVEQAFPLDATPEDVEQTIQKWNENPGIHGIFIHQPMPSQISAQQISGLLNPCKDIEGIHPQNSARRFFAKARIGSCTALAIMELIDSTGVTLEGKEAVVVGHSEIVGRPVSMLLLDQLATTTVCHVATNEAGRLREHVKRAQILVVAVGEPELIKGSWIRPDAIVIDVGINVVQGHVVGDVEFEEAKRRASFISPVPGGVGPVTVMMVMKNAVEAFKLQRG